MSQLSENENDTVAFKVTVNGKESSQADTQGLESIHVEDHLEKMGTCTLEFSLGGMDWSNFSMGNEVVVEIEGGDSKTHFVGYVTSIRHTWKAGQEYCTLEAMDPLCKMAATRNTKKWEKMKDSAIATELISSSACKPGTIDPSSITEDYTFQRNESNLSIAKRLAARNGFRISAKAGKIQFVKREYTDDAIEIPPEQLMSLDVTRDSTMIPKDTEVIGWDYKNKTKTSGNQAHSGCSSRGTGSIPASPIHAAGTFICDVLAKTDGQAAEMAKGAMEGMAMGFVKGKATIQGNGRLAAGGKVKFTGLAVGFNSEGIVESATHDVKPGEGMTTSISFKGNTLPL